MSHHSTSAVNTRIFRQETARRIEAEWEKGPAILEKALFEPLFDHPDFMRGILHASRQYLQSPPPPPWRVFVDGKPATPAQLRWLAVQDEEQTFEGYAKTLDLEFPKREVSIILDGCETGIPQIRRLLTPLLHDLFSIVGYPARLNHACLYAGRYRTTATGIHKDPCHVLMFCGFGKKTMAFWPNDYFPTSKTQNDHLSSSDISAYLKDALVLDIQPLDVLYWPADYWHVSLSEADHFNAALSLGIYHRGSSVEQHLTIDFLKPTSPTTWVKEYPALDIHGFHIKAKGKLSPVDLQESALNKFLEHWNHVLEILRTPGESEFHALRIALERITSAGFGALPQSPVTSPPNLDGVILSCEVPQSLMIAAARNGFLLGANGSVSFHAGNTEAIDVVLEQLRMGDELTLDSLLASATSDENECIRAVLREAIEAGAIGVVAA